MRKILMIAVLGIVALGFACSPKVASKGKAENTMEAKEDMSATDQNAYTTKVLQGDLPSPRKEMTGSINGVGVTVNYGSPSAKGRDLWGGLVAYDAIWRTGANEATTFEIGSDAMIEGQKLAAGKYALFTKPSEGSWEIIFNSDAGQWGAYNHDPAKDVLKVTVTPKEVSDFSESMDFIVEDGNVVLRWGNMAVPFAVGGA